jgi:3-methylcrotonyl-CoA carboxylase alpha subunit
MKFIARHGGNDIPVEISREGTGYCVKLGDRSMHADLVNAGGFVRSLLLEDGTQLALVHHRDGNRHEISVAGARLAIEVVDPLSLKRKRRDDEIGAGGMIKALMPGRVVRVLAAKGDQVRKGAGLLILEAMKMENEITAPADGVVDDVFVEAGQTVEAGADLVHVTNSV